MWDASSLTVACRCNRSRSRPRRPCDVSPVRHRKQVLSLTLFILLYPSVESIHRKLHRTILNVHVSAIHALWGIAASLLSPQQMMLMLKHPDGLASFAQGQKRRDTDSIWLKKKKKWGEVEDKKCIIWSKWEVEPHNVLFSKCTLASRLCFPGFVSVWESITWWFVINCCLYISYLSQVTFSLHCGCWPWSCSCRLPNDNQLINR